MAGSDIDMAAVRDDRPSWDLYRKMADSPLSNPARRQATLWALQKLEERMGPDWLERYWEAAGHVPAEVNLGGAHVGALASLLELALRLYLLTGTPGIGSVRKEMRNDLRDDRRRHAALQLELAGLAMRSGFSAALEHRSGRQTPPSDALLQRDKIALRVETFAVILDQHSQEGRSYWDHVMGAIRRINVQFDVDVAGDLGERQDDDDLAELLRLIEAAAQIAAETRQETPVMFRQANLRVLPSGSMPYELRSAVETSQGWPRVEARLLQKATQAARAGGGWLRADLMDGTWQFTPWARAGLRDKIDQISTLINPALSRIDGVAGIVVSSGACQAQGQFRGLSTRTADRSYGFVRTLPGSRVRETMIIPVTAAGRKEADSWAELYNLEDTWLDWALSRADLPPCRRIFGH
jgi:hypothetical protein